MEEARQYTVVSRTQMKRTYGTAYLLLALLVSCAPSNTKISKFCTPAGVCFSVSKMSVLMDQNTRKKTFEVNVVKPESLSQSAESALSDIAFEGIAGPGAEQTGADDAIVDVFPPTSGFFSVHSGYRGHYIKRGYWEVDTRRW